MMGSDLLTVAPWANTEIIVATIGAIGLVAGSGALWDYLKAQKRAPITAQEAEDAAQKADADAADELVRSAMTIVEKWEDMVTSLTTRHEAERASDRNRIDRLEARVQDQDVRIEQLRCESREQAHTIFDLRKHLARVEQWWEDEIVERWETVRQHPVPPAFPKQH